LVTHWAAQLGTPRLALQVLAEAHPATLTKNQVAAPSGFEQYADAFTPTPAATGDAIRQHRRHHDSSKMDEPARTD